MLFFSFQHQLYQSTNAYNCHRCGSTVGRSCCSNLDELFGYYDSNDIVPSKHLLVLKTSSRHLQDMSSRRLQDVFSVTILRLPRRLQDVLYI